MGEASVPVRLVHGLAPPIELCFERNYLTSARDCDDVGAPALVVELSRCRVNLPRGAASPQAGDEGAHQRSFALKRAQLHLVTPIRHSPLPPWARTVARSAMTCREG